MEVEENCAGGDTVTLLCGDSLTDVPPSHQELLTPNVIAAFRDPVQYFGTIAEQCRFPSLKRYLLALLTDSAWDLRLHTNDHGARGIAAFGFASESVHDIEISLPELTPIISGAPDAIREISSLIDWFHWSIYGCAGGLYQIEYQRRFADSQMRLLGDALEPTNTFMWGSSFGGDMFFYTTDDRAGMICHENGAVHFIGTVAETIDWICVELLANHVPGFDYNHWLKKS